MICQMKYVLFLASVFICEVCARAGSSQRGDDLCLTNLATLCTAIQQRTLSVIGEDFPSNLQMFVCPASGHKPVARTNVLEWTDYIYVGGQRWNYGMIFPLIICPPENH